MSEAQRTERLEMVFAKQSWCPGETRWHLLTSTPLPRLDFVEFGKRSFKFGIEEPHRIKNFTEGCRCSCPVSLSKGEDAVVSQISHDRRVGNSIVDQVARLECGPGRTGNDLDEFKELH